VESKASLQNAVRERLKSRGYRVLVISDANRALGRFSPVDEPPADCVVFSAAELGGIALEAFNRFGTDEHTCNIPAILLVDRRQTTIIKSARRGPKRRLLALPLKVRELRAALNEALQGVDRRDAGSL
jgi:DNA-binding response OmpR family regulator